MVVENHKLEELTPVVSRMAVWLLGRSADELRAILPRLALVDGKNFSVTTNASDPFRIEVTLDIRCVVGQFLVEFVCLHQRDVTFWNPDARAAEIRSTLLAEGAPAESLEDLGASAEEILFVQRYAQILDEAEYAWEHFHSHLADEIRSTLECLAIESYALNFPKDRRRSRMEALQKASAARIKCRTGVKPGPGDTRRHARRQFEDALVQALYAIREQGLDPTAERVREWWGTRGANFPDYSDARALRTRTAELYPELSDGSDEATRWRRIVALVDEKSDRWRVAAAATSQVSIGATWAEVDAVLRSIARQDPADPPTG